MDDPKGPDQMKLRIACGVCLLLPLAGCSHSSSNSAPSSSSAPASSASSSPGSSVSWPSPAKRHIDASKLPRGLPTRYLHVDTTKPEAVAQAFAVLQYTTDSRTDTSANAAARRASRYATSALAHSMAQAPTTSGDAAWSALVDHGGYRTATAKTNTDDGPPDTTTTAFRSEVVTTVDHPGSTSTVVIYLTLNHQGDRWVVSSFKAAQQ